AALAVGLELPLRPNDTALVAVPAAAERLDGDGLAVQRIELRLVVERIDLRRPPVHEEEDDALRLRLEVRLLRGHRADVFRLRLGRVAAVAQAVTRAQ